MRNRFIIIIVFSLTVLGSSCKKERFFWQKEEALVRWSGTSLLDGCDWTLIINNISYHPEELGSEYHIDGLKVNVQYKEMKGKWPCGGPSGGITSIKIKSIEKI